MPYQRLWISLLFIFSAIMQSQAAFLRVNQSGSDFLGSTYTTIQAAVNDCTPANACDEILITDSEIYAEQVTIDSTKANIWLHSLDEANPATIRWRDITAVHPKTGSEALNMDQWFDAGNQYDLNGALRLIYTSDIKISHIKIDGDKRFMYGFGGIWNFKDPLTGGNVGILVRNSGKVHVTHTEITNCWNAIYLKGRNLGGQNANVNAADQDAQNNIPLSGYGQAGRGLFEYNKIYDNAWAFFGESEWDLGSTIRYNLIYNNYARAGEVSSMSSGTPDDKYEAGGFLKMKDVTLAVYQIYNNTFKGNHHNLASQWKAGKQHIMFNNIWATPHALWKDNETGYFEIGGKMDNHSYSVTELFNGAQAPQTQSVQGGNIPGVGWSTFDSPIIGYSYFNLWDSDPSPFKMDNFAKGGTFKVTVGGVPYDVIETQVWSQPAKTIVGENWWYQDIAWQSTDPADPRFLCPDWDNTDVDRIILNKGKSDTGLRDADGTAPDIGALAKGALLDCVWGGSPNAPKINLVGTSPMLKVGTKGQITFVIDVENAELDALSNVKFQVIKYYDDIPVITGDSPNIPTTAWPAGTLINSTAKLKPGSNEVVLDIDLGSANYSNLDVIVSGDINGVSYSSNQETFQYRGSSSVVARQYNMKVSFTDLLGNPIDSAGAGEAIKVVAKIVDFDGVEAVGAKSNILNVRTSTWLGNKVRPSIWNLSDPAYANWETTIKTGQPEFTSVTNLEAANVAFSSAGSETLCLTGTEGADKSAVVFGCAGITIVPGAAWSLALISPESSKGKAADHTAAIGKGRTNVVVQLFDIFGNPALNDAGVVVALTSSDQAIAVNPANGIGSDGKGQVTIGMDVIGNLGSKFVLTASFVGGTNNGVTDFSNVEVATPPLGIKVKPNADGVVSAIRQPSGTCVELDMAALDEDNAPIPDLAEPVEFYIEASGGPAIYRDADCLTSVAPTEILATDAKGEIKLYITGTDVANGSFQTKLKANLLAKSSFPESIVFFSPEIFFIKEDGTPLPPAEMGLKEFMFVSFPLTIGAFFEGVPCANCNNEIAYDVDAARFVITDLEGNELKKIPLVGGKATFYAYGIEEFTDGEITVKSGAKSDTYAPIEIEESPVPYIINGGAQMFDATGDGIADSLTLKFSRVFDPDTLPLKITFRWPTGETGELTLAANKVVAGTDFVTITPADLVPSATTGQLSDLLDTKGPGSVQVYWPTAIINTGLINQKITDKMGPIIIDASISLTSLWDELTLTFSEPLNADSIQKGGLLFQFRRDGVEYKFAPVSASWLDSNRQIVWKFNSEDSIGVKAQSGDSVRIISDNTLSGLVVDLNGNMANPINQWAEIVGLKRVRIEYLKFFEAKMPDVDPAGLINKSWDIQAVKRGSVIDSLTAEQMNQGLFIPYSIFEGTKEPSEISLNLNVYLYTSIGGYVTSINKSISCEDKEYFKLNCLSDKSAIYLGWKYRDIEGRKVGSGIYIIQYNISKSINGSKDSGTAQEKIIDLGYHRLKD